MGGDRDEEVRRRAYRIWEEKGKPEGEHDRHWSEAEREMVEADGGKPGFEEGKPSVPDQETGGADLETEMAFSAATGMTPPRPKRAPASKGEAPAGKGARAKRGK